MPLVNMNDLLQHAYQNQYAIGAFDLINLDFLEAIIAGAEEEKAPVILSLAESHFDYFNFDLIMPAVVKAAQQASVPVAIHLDHGHSFDSAVKGINLGCNGVMIDASHHDLEQNIQLTKAVVDMAHACGITVEGELGYVPGVEGEDAERHSGEMRYTTVEEAQRYVAETGVDCLAVSIGTVHGRMQGQPQLDFERLAEINQALQLPLVIHGGTGLSDDQFQQLIANGVVKINYYTALSDAAARQVKANLEGKGFTDLVKGMQAAIKAEVKRCIQLWGSTGQADQIQAQTWLPVAHVIIFNTEGLDEQQSLAMMEQGKKELSTIPGVLAVDIGRAVKTDASYRYCWLISFAHEAVIDSYKHHPTHVAFADHLFRPVAGNRISIDYQILP